MKNQKIDRFIFDRSIFYRSIDLFLIGRFFIDRSMHFLVRIDSTTIEKNSIEPQIFDRSKNYRSNRIFSIETNSFSRVIENRVTFGPLGKSQKLGRDTAEISKTGNFRQSTDFGHLRSCHGRLTIVDRSKICEMTLESFSVEIL